MEQCLCYPVVRLCHALGVSASGYYAWRKRPVSARAHANAALLVQIRRSYRGSRQTYGSPRVHADLVAQGARCGHNRVARLMRLHQIRSKRIRRYRVSTTDSTHAWPVAPNQLNREFQSAAPNQKWLTDITYIATQEGWLYLAVVLDMFSRKVIGWAMEQTLATSLSLSALQMALLARQPQTELLHHSDRGAQYASGDYRAVLEALHIQVSMSRIANCYDNAPMESFFATLKTELLDEPSFRSRAEARSHIFAYIEGFYNRTRRHSALGYLSPEQFERSHQSGI